MHPRYTARSVTAILADLLLPLSPTETAVMLQIILRDLSPLLYPPPSALGDVALTRFTSHAYNEVGVYDAMRLWHDGLPRLYRAVADLDWVAWQAEQALRASSSLYLPSRAECKADAAVSQVTLARSDMSCPGSGYRSRCAPLKRVSPSLRKH